MLLTPHQSQYYAWQLTRHAASNSLESLAPTLVNAQIDLNPHQVEAALDEVRLNTRPKASVWLTQLHHNHKRYCWL